MKISTFSTFKKEQFLQKLLAEIRYLKLYSTPGQNIFILDLQLVTPKVSLFYNSMCVICVTSHRYLIDIWKILLFCLSKLPLFTYIAYNKKPPVHSAVHNGVKCFLEEHCVFIKYFGIFIPTKSMCDILSICPHLNSISQLSSVVNKQSQRIMKTDTTKFQAKGSLQQQGQKLSIILKRKDFKI